MKLIIDIPDHLYNVIKNKECTDKNVLTKAVENGTPFDKIRAEIKTKYDSIPWRNNDYDDGWIEALEWVFDDVLDKYKAERTDT